MAIVKTKIIKGAVIVYGRGAVQIMGGAKISVQENGGGGAKFQCKPLEGGGKISVHRVPVHRDLKALLKQIKMPLKVFAADHIQYNTTSFDNVPNMIGHFVICHRTTSYRN